MPVWIDDGRHGARSRRRPHGLHASDCLEIGLVNNMPGSASKAAERQFAALLDAAAADMPVRLRLYTLGTAAELDAAHAAAYRSIDELWDSPHDGVIVTGNEPRARNLTDESYWPILIDILEWANDNAVSTIWSCLAAHAAVLHLDGIDRQPLDDKQSGVFEFTKVSDDGLMRGVTYRVRMPHSRWNELPAAALASCGYRILTRSERAGIDAFVKQGSSSLLVFFQGHPEYEPDTLLREYRRDIGRFLRRERDSYPAMPRYYFDDAAAAGLLAFRERALIDRREEMLAAFPTATPAADAAPAWRRPAVRIYRNWLMYMASQKSRRTKPSRASSSRTTVAP